MTDKANEELIEIVTDGKPITENADPKYETVCKLESALRAAVRNKCNFSHSSGLFQSWASDFEISKEALEELVKIIRED